jgi:hypothetical protein
MAVTKDKAALSIQQSALSRGKQKHSAFSNQHSARRALSSQHSALSQGKTKAPKSKTANQRKRRRTNRLHFPEVAGKTVEFIEMDWTAEFPCVEVGFDDKTALLVLLGSRLTMEPVYSDWKTGNQRPLRRWPARETGG